MTADAVQSLAINHTNSSVTLSLRLSQPLPETAVRLNMTKYNTVPTNRSDDMGNIVTEMVTWNTSAMFGELKQPLYTRDIYTVVCRIIVMMHVYIILHIKYVC